jgi:hypothetical protein
MVICADWLVNVLAHVVICVKTLVNSELVTSGKSEKRLEVDLETDENIVVA